MIDRRTALAGVVAMLGTQIFAPIARAAGFLAAQGAVPISDGPPSVQVFTPKQKALMTALCERILPTTDTPGAVAAGVPDYIEKLLADWAEPAERGQIGAGLDEVEAQSLANYAVSAAQATPAQQDALLTLAMDDAMKDGAAFFTAFRALVIIGYYTSEIGITQEREYLPVPGNYDGEFLYSRVNKVYSS